MIHLVPCEKEKLELRLKTSQSRNSEAKRFQQLFVFRELIGEAKFSVWLKNFCLNQLLLVLPQSCSCGFANNAAIHGIFDANPE